MVVPVEVEELIAGILRVRGQAKSAVAAAACYVSFVYLHTSRKRKLCSVVADFLHKFAANLCELSML